MGSFTNGWTFNTLKTLMDERHDHLKELRVADQRAIDAALVSQEKAIVKAETAADKRFELLNELRGGVATKEQVEALEKVVSDIAKRADTNEGQEKGSRATKAGIYAAIGAAVALISIVVIIANAAFK